VTHACCQSETCLCDSIEHKPSDSIRANQTEGELRCIYCVIVDVCPSHYFLLFLPIRFISGSHALPRQKHHQALQAWGVANTQAACERNRLIFWFGSPLASRAPPHRSAAGAPLTHHAGARAALTRWARLHHFEHWGSSKAFQWATRPLRRRGIRSRPCSFILLQHRPPMSPPYWSGQTREPD
jgi:hypothetical protein